jgi:hypothetical protein
MRCGYVEYLFVAFCARLKALEKLENTLVPLRIPFSMQARAVHRMNVKKAHLQELMHQTVEMRI